MISETWALFVREIRRWQRQKAQIFMMLVMPLIWLGLFGKSLNITALTGGFDTGAIVSQLPPEMLPYIDIDALNQSFASASSAMLIDLYGTTDYFSYMAAGMTTAIVLFSVMFAGVSIVWERRFGFLNKLLVSPIPRSSIVLSKVFGGVFKAMIQAVLVLFIAVLLGMQVTADLSIIDVLVVFAAIALLAFGLSSLFVAIATMIKRQETLMAAINLINLPLLFASNALFPLGQMPEWMQTIASVNPITYAADAVRTPLLGTATVESLVLDFTALVLFALVSTTVGIMLARYMLKK